MGLLGADCELSFTLQVKLDTTKGSPSMRIKVGILDDEPLSRLDRLSK
jgi:hypothetical protein